MPVTCIVVNCGSRADRDHVHFFRVPSVRNSFMFPHLTELSKKRRNLWLAAVKRDDLTESKIRNQRVCSKHFISGKPSPLTDEDHPDWVPSQHLGHVSMAYSKRKSAISRSLRINKRKKFEISSEQESEGEHENMSCEEEMCGKLGTASQTDLTMEELSVKFEQLKFASQKIATLEQKIENSPFGLMENTSNVGKWKYYVGFEYEMVKTVIFMEVEPYVVTTSTTALTPFNMLLLTLTKLRLDLHFKHLAYSFKISPSTASVYFENIIHILYKRLKSLIIWPDRLVSNKNVPGCFKEAFQEKTTVIIDCFEVFIEKPESYLTQQQCWSNYKHHHTIKYLIGITPQRTICYISSGWGGRTSDKQMVELGQFCNFILPGDVVLADRGFLIKDSLGIIGAKLVIPAFTRGKNQLHPLEIEATRHIAHVRIHVERIIGVIKNKFRIFKATIPISMLKRGNLNDDASLLDKIVTVCSGLINLVEPIVPL
ncbi:uncharacterized protein [Diabrotica undecimpunctata]|uniref:uncharacterized protein n=1 Tax=Diabrotica undecimpunctata TaxID=50387 RepID=UPI003B63D7DD